MSSIVRTAAGGALLASIAAVSPATAQTSGPPQSPQPTVAQAPTVFPPVTVEAQTPPARLSQPTAVGSFLPLTPMETPASVDVITQEDMAKRGLRDLIDVFNGFPGVRSGNLPGEPGVTTIRGFSRAATGYSIDGARSIDPLLISRNYDSWAFDRVELLRGPASVVNGTGALAGAINLVTRQPVLGQDFREALISYGSFNSLRSGFDINQTIGDKAAVRTTLGYSRSDGYVNRTESRNISFTSALTAKPTDRLTVNVSVAYFNDRYTTPYQGLPLISRTLARDPSSIVSAPGGLVVDKSLTNSNYNVNNGFMGSDAYWLRGNVAYALSDNWRLTNEFTFYQAVRDWANSEDYTFNAATGKLDRTTTRITHNQTFVSDRVAAAYDGQIGGFRNRFSAGYEFYQTSLFSQRRFGNTTSVDPFNPVVGSFPADTPANNSTRQNFDSRVTSNGLFAENAFNITPDWIAVAGLRYEKINLDRRIDNVTTGSSTPFGRPYDALSWRVGTVYNVLPGVSVYGQYTRGVIPITTLLLSNVANASFNLSSGNAFEAGVKASLLNDRVVALASLYQIDQDNILTRSAINPALTVQGGTMRSRGIELDISAKVTDQWTIGGNASLQNVEFTSLRDSLGRNLAGKRPPNVPNQMANAYTTYKFAQFPLTVGASVRYVGDSYTDNPNTIKMASYTVFDAFASYDLPRGTLTLRGRNLTNAFYAEWSGYSTQQVYIAPPFSVDLTYRVRF